MLGGAYMPRLIWPSLVQMMVVSITRTDAELLAIRSPGPKIIETESICRLQNSGYYVKYQIFCMSSAQMVAILFNDKYSGH